MAATSDQQRAVVTLGRLAFAYGALLAQGDQVRASIVLREFQAYYNANSLALKTVMQDAGADGSWGLPSMAPLPYDARMRKAMVPSLVYLMGRRGADSVRAQEAALAMPEQAGLISEWWNERMGILRPYFGSDWNQYAAFHTLSTSTPPSDLPAVIHQAAIAGGGGGTPSSPTATPSPAPPPGVPSGAPIALPEVTILGRRYKGVPLWGWIGVIGAVGIAAVVLLYGALKRGKRR